MKIVTAEEMRAIDRATTEKYGVPSLALMENAGAAVAEFAQKHFEFNTVCVVCGKGNNGGDGFVAARKLREAGKQVVVLVLAKGTDDLRGDAAEMFKKLTQNPLWIADDSDFRKAEVQQALKADLIVDAILGTGFKPRITGIAAKAIDLLNGLEIPILAIDVPSGVNADAMAAPESDAPFVRSDAIVTFTAPKPVHVYVSTTTGPIAVADIGSPSKLVREQSKLEQDVLTIADLAFAFPARKVDAHKGEFGSVLVVGGSAGKAGAAAMAGMAALHAGAGLVTVACPRSVQPTVATFAPEMMTEPLPETPEGTLSLEALPRLQELIEGKDCLAIGPGLSRNPETAELVRKLVAGTGAPIVLDADGLNAFEGHTDELNGEATHEGTPFPRTLVLTPHPGEMSRLLGGVDTRQIQSNRLKIATEFAQQHKVIVVLKGHRTIIASPCPPSHINVTGNPGMAKGGSGDVLTGIVAALLARQSGNVIWISQDDPSSEGQEILAMMKEFLSTRDPTLGEVLHKKMAPRHREVTLKLNSLYVSAAVCLHGLAGDIACDVYGEYAMTTTQIIESIGEAIALCRQQSPAGPVYLQR